jgi:hypothetical protein
MAPVSPSTPAAAGLSFIFDGSAGVPVGPSTPVASGFGFIFDG